MTSIGRGRGWARPAEKENILRRPGQSSSPKLSELDELVDRIYNDLHIDEQFSSDDKVKELATFIKNLAENQSPEIMVEKLWKQSLEDRCFSIKLMKLYSDENSKNVKNIKEIAYQIKCQFFRMMQECYEKKDEWRKENPLQLANLTWIIGSTIQALSTDTTACILGPPLINCCSLLLDTATEDDTETVAIQIYLNAKRIEAVLSARGEIAVSKDLKNIVNKARTILVNRNVSARTRALLLLIIDFDHQCYEPLVGELEAFYVSILGRTDNDSQFKTGREFNTASYFYGILTKGLKAPISENHATPTIIHEPTRNELPPPSVQQPQVQKINRGPNGGGSGPFPRAIRGSGASESSKEHRNDKRSPRGHKEKLTDEQVWSAKQNTGSKVWGHDDRFDNDYE